MSIQISPRNPPTRFVRKSRNMEHKDSTTPILKCEASARPFEEAVVSKKEKCTITFDRSKYNRIIGEMIRLDSECHCDDLPIIDQTAYFEELHINLPEKKK
jgi:hypothetical protein